MKKLAFVAALVAIGVAVPLSIGSSHREAALSSIDPTADDTDVYAFTAKDDPSTADRDEEKDLTVVANWIPFEDPAGGPNFYRFDDRARYYINVDNTGDGRADVKYRFKFKTKYENGGRSFLYAAPTVDSIDSPNLLVKQTYSIDRITRSAADASRKPRGRKHGGRKHGNARHRGRGHHKGRHHRKRRHGRRSHSEPRFVTRIADNVPVAPNNVGPKTMPDYTKLATQAVKTLSDGTKVFAGQRDDPFFVDLGATFDALNIRMLTGDKGQGKDDLAGYAVHSIVLQLPERRVTSDHESVSGPNDPEGVVGVWASTERQKLQVVDDANYGRGDYVQVSRLGNPLVNEVVIPLKDKDKFNRTKPADDAANYGQYVVEPEVAKLLNALFGLGVKETDRSDIVLALLQGIPGLNQQTGKPVDTIKLTLGTPPSSNPDRLGVLGGDNAGFPNGRRLADD